MSKAWLAGVIALAALAALGAADFPAAPPTAGAAEAAGLRRVDTAELNQQYAGKRVLRTAKGELIRLDLHLCCARRLALVRLRPEHQAME
jgi:hypothetical protein